MELYLDSANMAEIKEAFDIGGLTGLTTTPTFMHKEGVVDLDKTIKELSSLVPTLQLEALGKNMSEILNEAKRLMNLGLDPKKTVFKIPVSLEGVKACYELRKMGLLVNIHLVYTIQQAYMAMVSGATYVCPLVGRLQDQGHDALALMQDCVDLVHQYNYDTKIMFSSVRNAEHVRNAIQCGAHACTAPWKIIQKLTENHFTTIGTKEFFEHTGLIMLKVKDIVSKTPKVGLQNTLNQTLVQMTVSKLGAVAILDDQQTVCGIFTDGDLRRMLEKDSKTDLDQKVANLVLKKPVTIDFNSSLNDALRVFKDKQIDSLVVEKDGKYFGMLDVQELLAAISSF